MIILYIFILNQFFIFFFIFNYIKMKWINSACDVIMIFFSAVFAAMALCEHLIFVEYKAWLSKVLCISINLIPPALTFIVLLSIVYGYVNFYFI